MKSLARLCATMRAVRHTPSFFSLPFFSLRPRSAAGGRLAMARLGVGLGSVSSSLKPTREGRLAPAAALDCGSSGSSSSPVKSKTSDQRDQGQEVRSSSSCRSAPSLKCKHACRELAALVLTLRAMQRLLTRANHGSRLRRLLLLLLRLLGRHPRLELGLVLRFELVGLFVEVKSLDLSQPLPARHAEGQQVRI